MKKLIFILSLLITVTISFAQTPTKRVIKVKGIDLSSYSTKHYADSLFALGYTKLQVDSIAALKANDNAVVHLTVNETIAGVKTFNDTLKLGLQADNDAHLRVDGTNHGLVIDNGSTSSAKILPFNSDIYFQNSSNTGNFIFSGLAGAQVKDAKFLLTGAGLINTDTIATYTKVVKLNGNSTVNGVVTFTGSSSQTNILTGNVGAGGSNIVRNTSNTDGNFTAISALNAAGYNYGGIIFKAEKQGITSAASGSISIMVRNAAINYFEAAKFDSSGNLFLRKADNNTGDFLTRNSSGGQVSVRTAAQVKTDLGFTTGSGVPSTTPTSINLFYLDATNKKLYVSTGTISSADWTILN